MEHPVVLVLIYFDIFLFFLIILLSTNQISHKLIFLILAAQDSQLWRHDNATGQLVNKNNKTKLSVDINWEVKTGNSTIIKDQSTVPHRVFGLKGDDDDVTTNPKVVEEALNGTDAGQTWFVTEVKTKDATKKFYTFSINSYFLTGEKQKKIIVKGT